MAYIAIMKPGCEPQRHELKDLNLFGRSADCHVWINDRNISRRHCKLERIGTKWMLSDLDSTNGTWLDAARVRRYALKDGETFFIGDVRIVFHADARVEHRPSDPCEASRISDIFSAAVVNSDSDIADALDDPHFGREPLKVARATQVKPNAPRHVRATPSIPLAFQRPPAQPIVQGAGSGGWVGSFVARLGWQ